MEDDWSRWCKKNWLNTILFLLLCVLMTSGFYQLLFFIPGNRTILEDFGNEAEDNPRLFFSSIIGFGCVAIGFFVHFRQKQNLLLLKHALQILKYKGELTPAILPYDHWSLDDLTDFEPNRKLALGLALDAQGILHSFCYSDRIVKLGEIMEDLDEAGVLYHGLQRLDHLILDSLEDRIKRKYPRQVYYLRFYLLKDFCEAYQKREFLVYNEQNRFKEKERREASLREIEGDACGIGHQKFYPYRTTSVTEFCKKVLNQYYKHREDYPKQSIAYDPRSLRKYFSELEQLRYLSKLSG